MFFDLFILNQQHKARFGFAWLAATRGIKYVPLEVIKKTDIEKLCANIAEYLISNSSVPRQRFSLRLSAFLINGTIKIYKKQVDIVFDEIVTLVKKPISTHVDFAVPTKVPTDRKKPRKRRVPAQFTETPEDIVYDVAYLVQKQALEDANLPALVSPKSSTAMVSSKGRPVLSEIGNLLDQPREASSLETEEVRNIQETSSSLPTRPKNLRRFPSQTSSTSGSQIGHEQVLVVAQVHRESDGNVFEQPQPVPMVIEEESPEDLELFAAPPAQLAEDNVQAMQVIEPAEPIQSQTESQDLQIVAVEEPKQLQNVEKLDKPRRKRKIQVVEQEQQENVEVVSSRIRKDLLIQSRARRNKKSINTYRGVAYELFRGDLVVNQELFVQTPFEIDLTDLVNCYMASEQDYERRDESISETPTTSIPRRKKSQPTPPIFASDAIESIPQVTVEEATVDSALDQPRNLPEAEIIDHSLHVPLHELQMTVDETVARAGSSPIKRPRRLVQAESLTKDLVLPSISVPVHEEISAVKPPSVVLQKEKTKDYQIRQQEIVQKVYGASGPLKFEDMCEKPITKLKAARAFSDLLMLCARGYVKLNNEDDSLELKSIEKGPKMFF